MPRKHTMPCLAAVIAALMVFGALPLTAQAVTPFTIVALPDTQNYTLSYPATLTAQTQWIATNKSTLNIAFVTEEGDLSNNASAAEYDNANTSFNLLNGVVPYSVVPGNHDSNPTLFKDHFGPSRYTAISGSSSWYMGSSADVAGGDGLSFAQKFSAGGYNFLHLGLKYNAGADATTVSWAQNIMANNPGLPTIITTHSYMNADATGS
jgi:3',5'-cyclic AMP phosphodiesterase CpdA